MKYDDPELIDRIAAEYVLGTLSGSARGRFERLVTEREDVRRAVESWNQRLDPLAEHAPKVPPPPGAWETICARITPIPKDESDRHWLQTVAFWKRFASTAALIAVIMGIILVLPEPDSPGPVAGDYVVMMEDELRRAIWVIDTANQVAELRVEKVAPMEMPAGMQCLLWLKEAETGDMYVLGVLPDEGSATIPVPPKLRHKLPGTLMVSIEDAGTLNPDHPGQPLDIHSSWMMPISSQI